MRVRALAASIAALFLVNIGTAEASPPTATTGGFSNVTQTSAHVAGTVKPNNESTTWHFEYGTTTAYGTNTPESAPIAAGSGSTPVGADLTNLTPGSVYHYRVVATNASGVIPGKDRTFTTRPAVSIQTNTTVFPFGHSVTVSGRVFGTTVNGITVKLMENPYPFSGFSEVSTTTTDASGNYQFIRPVLTNTAYKVRAETKPAGTSGTAFAYEQDILSLKANTTRPRRGHSVLFTGQYLPARIGTVIRIQRLGRGGWHTAKTATLSATNIPNTASFAVRVRRVKSGLYRAYSAATFDHVTSISRAKRIRVRP